MQSDLEDLQIKEEELEELINLNFSTALVIDAYRAFTFKNPKQIVSIFLTELVLLGLVLIFVLPISLLVLRSSGNLPEDVTSITWLLTLILGIALFSTLLGNLYLWQQAKQLQVLAELMNDIERYNKMIHAIYLVDQLELVRSSTQELNQLHNRKEVLEVLGVIKESLLNAVRVEKIVRKHQEFIGQRYELFANLENNLTTLMSFDARSQASEYSRLMNDALQIGISVHKEMRALQNPPYSRVR